MSDLFCSQCVSTLYGYLCAAYTRMISEPRTPVKENPLLHDINSLYPIRCYISWILKDLTSDRCEIWIVWTLHMNINLLQSMVCVHGDLLNVHCPKWLEMKHKTSKSPERAVFLYAGLGSLPAVAISRELKTYKNLVGVVMYILSASVFTDPQCTCIYVCVRVVIKSSHSGIRLPSIILLVGFCEPERRNEHPEFIGH